MDRGLVELDVRLPNILPPCQIEELIDSYQIGSARFLLLSQTDSVTESVAVRDR